jgi:hypothetical protein
MLGLWLGLRLGFLWRGLCLGLRFGPLRQPLAWPLEWPLDNLDCLSIMLDCIAILFVWDTMTSLPTGRLDP